MLSLNTFLAKNLTKFDVCVEDKRKRVIRSARKAFYKDRLKRTVKFS